MSNETRRWAVELLMRVGISAHEVVYAARALVDYVDGTPVAAPKRGPAPIRWTPERKQLLRERRTAGEEMRDILPKLNALDGPPITTNRANSYAVAMLKLPSQSTSKRAENGRRTILLAQAARAAKRNGAASP